ncbi:hypothetical protein [Roseinatronobacter alkalisoli]|uniref:Uncharacterized protein n=1 Tax=Roseinatronobacter alkalisoli TaxID=3028235 RepID=A0ABT5TFA0_9RHOB|nr:hypothetical protein [Roseinatronobacter sp. HJB301]MDD7973793.1 hypothetical protein [Roseinatronobacter sp. HJB301]
MNRVSIKSKLFAVPLDDGWFGFAKELPSPVNEVAFLDLKCPTPEVETSVAKTAPVLFRIWMHKSATSGKKSWKRGGFVELDDAEFSPSSFFKKDPISGEYSLYAGLDEIPTTREACIGLERAAVWERDHAEARLSDYFAGRENVFVKSLLL